MINRENVDNLLLNYLAAPDYVTAITDDVLALYAPLLAELREARKIVETLRRHRDAGGEVWGSINRDFAAYDKARAK